MSYIRKKNHAKQLYQHCTNSPRIYIDLNSFIIDLKIDETNLHEMYINTCTRTHTHIHINT